MQFDKDFMEQLINSTTDESTKIISYLEEEKRKNRSYNLLILIFTILGAIGGVTAAIVSIILLFK